MTKPDPWLLWASEIQALAQTGLHYTENVYDKMHYGRLLEIAAEIMHQHTAVPTTTIHNVFAKEWGYATPKIDVRSLVFVDNTVLLVKEVTDNKWSVPGGFADINSTLKEMAEREVLEESGFIVEAVRLLSCLDSRKHNHSNYWPHIYKFCFQCNLLGGTATPSVETLAVDFFPLDRLPPLSLPRITPKQIFDCFEQIQHPEWPTVFD